MSDLRIEPGPIEGLLVIRLPVHADNRGWFKENWQREKMTALGLPDFAPVQQNVSFNEMAGVTRGLHAEPWDKLVSVAAGRVFGAWVDLREGSGFGTSFSLELDPGTAVFVPRGVGNGYQTLEPGTAYAYLVNDHWSAERRSRYSFVNLADETLQFDWPLRVLAANVSAADQHHPQLSEVTPVKRPRPLILGANGQVGLALRAALPTAAFLTQDDFDFAHAAAFSSVDWDAHDIIINAAAYTSVDAAETDEGRREAWRTNVTGVGRLVEVVRTHRLTLVHFSSDYVFDGTQQLHREDECLAPLGAYGVTKAAGDALVQSLHRHYIMRTSWVVGEGRNFVRTMTKLARDGASPVVVDDQYGRPSFAHELAAGVKHLVTTKAPYGTYNLTASGEATTWAGLARTVFERFGRDPSDITGVSTEQYELNRQLAPRPRHSTLDLTKLEETGFVPRPWRESLHEYLRPEEEDVPR